MRINLGILLALVCSLSSMATTMIPVPIVNKLEDSDAVIVGTVVSQTYKRHPVLNVVTETKIKVEESAGVNPNQFHNNQFIEVTSPGGKWADMKYMIPGSPKFTIGERTAVLVKENSGSLFIHHLGGGKFNFIKKNGQEYIQAQVYSDKPGVGLMKFSEFENVIETSHLRQKLTKYSKRSEIMIAKPDEKNKIQIRDAKRMPASANMKQNYRKVSSEEKIEQHNFTKGFLILVFIIMGLFFTFSARKEQ